MTRIMLGDFQIKHANEESMANYKNYKKMVIMKKGETLLNNYRARFQTINRKEFVKLSANLIGRKAKVTRNKNQ